MGSLNWQEVPENKTTPRSEAKTAHGVLGFIVGIMSGAAFSLLLMGLIAGYVLGKLIH